jgi:hypothetical protein
LGEHCASEPLLQGVKFTGINFFSQETELPTFNSGKLLSKGNVTLRVPDLVAQWRSVGYSTRKLEAAFLEIVRAFGAAFPRQTIVMMTDYRGFPPLGADGRISPTAMHIGVTELFRIGRRELGSRFGMAYNGLKARNNDFLSIKAVAKFSDTNPTGYQTTWPVSHNTTDSDGEMKPLCVMNGGVSPCYARDVMTNILSIAHRNNAHFLEIFPADAANPELRDLLEATHGEFLTR